LISTVEFSLEIIIIIFKLKIKDNSRGAGIDSLDDVDMVKCAVLLGRSIMEETIYDIEK
jgi:hypothetical protein